MYQQSFLNENFQFFCLLLYKSNAYSLQHPYKSVCNCWPSTEKIMAWIVHPTVSVHMVPMLIVVSELVRIVI